MSKYVGQRCGDYRLTAFLGEGGFAEVYLGENLYLGTKAAVKILKHGFTAEKMEEFRREVQTITHLRHARIVQLIAFGETTMDGGRVPFLVMDYARHGSLDKHHPSGTKLPLETILTYMKQLTEALQYAHEQQVVHRDIKPANFLLGDDEKVLLSDFGIAVLVHGDESWKEQKRVGSWHYAAPEHFNGKAVPASDQYSLGVIVYEWLCGELPFQGNFIQLAYQHRSVSPPPLQKKIAIAPVLENTILRALSKEPEQRFPNVQDFVFALDYVSQEEITASEPKVPIGTTQCIYGGLASIDALAWSPDKARITATSSSGDFAAQDWDARSGKMLGIYYDGTGFADAHRGITGWGHPYSPDGRHIASIDRNGTLQIERITSDTIRTHTHNGEKLAWSPHGRRIATISTDYGYSSSSDSDKWTQPILILDAAKRAVICTCRDRLGSLIAKTRKYSSGARVKTVEWSPDEQYIAASYNDETVRIWDTTKGKRLHVYHNQKVDQIVWSPDGQRIACPDHSNNTVQIWDPFAGKILCTYKGDVSYVDKLLWSPDARYLATLGYKTVQVWDSIDGRTLFTFDNQSSQVQALAWFPDGRLLASGSGDGMVRVWNPTKRVTFWANNNGGYLGQIQALAWSPNGLLLTSSSNNGEVRVWGTTTGKTYCNYSSQTVYGQGQVRAIAWSPDGTRIARSISNSDNIQIWNPAIGTTPPTSQKHANEVWASPLLPHSQGGISINSMVWSSDGLSTAIANTGDRTVQIQDFASRQTLSTYRGHTTRLPTLTQSNQLQAVAWSPDGRRIASADLSDRTVHVWDPTNGKPICIYYGYSDQVSELIWSPDSEHIASFGLDKKEIYVWNSMRGETLCIYRGYITQDLAESPMRSEASGRWDESQGYITQDLAENLMRFPPVQVLIWSPNGQRIASVGYKDKTVHIWNPTDGNTTYIYREHTSEIQTLAWSSDSKRIASAGNEVRVWRSI